MKLTIWTLTVDDDNGLFTSVHLSEADAIQYVLDAYDPDGEFTGKPVTETPADDLQSVMDGRRLVVHIESHTVDVDDVKLEIIHSRDPDGECGFSYYVNGRPSDGDSIEIGQYDLDAGRGYEFADWAGQAAGAKATASDAVWAELEQYYAEPAGDEYVEGMPDDNDWMDHLDATPDNRAWWTTNHPGVPLNYLFD